MLLPATSPLQEHAVVLSFAERPAVRASAGAPTFVDLFAGCGGLSLGLELAGFRPVFVNELNESAMDTYLRNRRHEWPLLEADKAYDIHDLTGDVDRLDGLAKHLKTNRGYGDIDLVVGGPPCQGYSGIGHRRTFTGLAKEQVPSNHLYRDMAVVVGALRPKLFLFENVKGLLSSRWSPDGEAGEIWRDVQNAFEELDLYDIRPKLVHAKSYGVPQNRPRVLMVGIRRDLGWRPVADAPGHGLLPHPGGTPPHLASLLGDLVDPAYPLPDYETRHYPSAAVDDTQKWFRRRDDGPVLPKGAPVTDQVYSRHDSRVVEKFRYMIAHGGKMRAEHRTKKFAQRVLPSRWGEDGPSITATSLPDDYVHFSQPRSLTVREWARLQTFPDWYEFSGKRTTGGRRRAGDPSRGDWARELPKYTQIGNAVPVWLARTLGEHFLQFLR